jgi:uncharacterized membrane protein YqjE
MRPWQNALAIVGGFFAAAAVWPFSPRLRLVCAAAAVVVVLVLFLARLGAHRKKKPSRRSSADTWSTIERIRDERAQRMRRRR